MLHGFNCSTTTMLHGDEDCRAAYLQGCLTTCCTTADLTAQRQAAQRQTLSTWMARDVERVAARLLYDVHVRLPHS